jgi:hypothetical protein
MSQPLPYPLCERDGDEENRQAEDRERRADGAGQQEVDEGVESLGFEHAQFTVDAHGRKLGRHGRAAAADDNEVHEQRSGFADDHRHEDGAHRAGLSETGQPDLGLEHYGDPDQQGEKGDETDRVVPREQDLPGQYIAGGRGPVAGAGQARQQRAAHGGGLQDAPRRLQRGRAQALNESRHARSLQRYSYPRTGVCAMGVLRISVILITTKAAGSQSKSLSKSGSKSFAVPRFRYRSRFRFGRRDAEIRTTVRTAQSRPGA